VVTDDDAVALLRDPIGRALVELLSGAPRSIDQLAEALPVERDQLVRQLERLEHAGLVARAESTADDAYRLHDDAPEIVQRSLEQTWSDSAARFERLAEEDT
jgi:predicted transcriptional regulator